MAFTYRLFLPTGDDVGQFATAAPDWRIGDEFRTGDGNRFRIDNIVSDEEIVGDDYAGWFTVVPVELAEPT
jgi:hypothetical protein